jgi:hypothetical protein
MKQPSCAQAFDTEQARARRACAFGDRRRRAPRAGRDLRPRAFIRRTLIADIAANFNGISSTRLQRQAFCNRRAERRSQRDAKPRQDAAVCARNRKRCRAICPTRSPRCRSESHFAEDCSWLLAHTEVMQSLSALQWPLLAEDLESARARLSTRSQRKHVTELKRDIEVMQRAWRRLTAAKAFVQLGELASRSMSTHDGRWTWKVFNWQRAHPATHLKEVVSPCQWAIPGLEPWGRL